MADDPVADDPAASGPKDDEPAAGAAPKDDGPSAGNKNKNESCDGSVPHSFVGDTPVAMADGTSKTIDQVQVGDSIENAVPGDSTNESHTVSAVIVTKTDHDFVDVSVRPAASSGGSAGKSSTLTTTYHHPFYDATRAAFVEARDLHEGDQLQTPSGLATVTAVRLYHATAVTYDLTIGGLHTYYVEAGTTPVLVHNCGSQPSGGRACSCANSSQGPGNGYSVAYETQLSPTSYPGLTRAAHFREANQNLLDAMDADQDFDDLMESIIPGIRARIQGAGGRAVDESPSDLGWTWHHHTDPGRMQLVPMGQHSAGGPFRPLFHPGGRGGFSIWG
jgi:pretoxin HINT domain-containing protein/HNH/ENDO VII superfamily nuclease